MRYQSVAFIVAMSLGALLYDADRLNQILAAVGWEVDIAKETAMRLPLALTLLLGIGALVTALGLTEPESEKKSRREARRENSMETLKDAFAKTLETGKWILNTPIAMMIILGGFLIDHIARMILTLNSEYYRRIELPEASFGIISAGFGLLGLFTPKLGRWLSENRSKTFNYLTISSCTFLGLLGMTFFVPFWGIAPMVLIYGSIGLAGFLVSAYLNAETPSESRATALSFKGLSYNLAYGGIGLLYSLLVYSLRGAEAIQSLPDEKVEAALFKSALTFFPAYFAFAFLLVLLFGILNRQAIDTNPTKVEKDLNLPPDEAA